MSIPQENLICLVSDYQKTQMMVLTIRYERCLKLENRYLNLFYNMVIAYDKLYVAGWDEFGPLLKRLITENLHNTVIEKKRVVDLQNLSQQIEGIQEKMKALASRLNDIVDYIDLIAEELEFDKRLIALAVQCRLDFQRINAPLLPSFPKDSISPNTLLVSAEDLREYWDLSAFALLLPPAPLVRAQALLTNSKPACEQSPPPPHPLRRSVSSISRPPGGPVCVEPYLPSQALSRAQPLKGMKRTQTSADLPEKSNDSIGDERNSKRARNLLDSKMQAEKDCFKGRLYITDKAAAKNRSAAKDLVKRVESGVSYQEMDIDDEMELSPSPPQTPKSRL